MLQTIGLRNIINLENITSNKIAAKIIRTGFSNFILAVGTVCYCFSIMRLHQILMNGKHGRRPQREPVPFQMLLPLELKKTVSGKSDRQTEAACMQELAVMFACFKKTEFEQKECLKEVTAFQTCYKNYHEKMSTQRDQGRKGILVPGEKKLTHRQLNELLKRFPPKK